MTTPAVSNVAIIGVGKLIVDVIAVRVIWIST